MYVCLCHVYSMHIVLLFTVHSCVCDCIQSVCLCLCESVCIVCMRSICVCTCKMEGVYVQLSDLFFQFLQMGPTGSIVIASH